MKLKKRILSIMFTRHQAAIKGIEAYVEIAINSLLSTCHNENKSKCLSSLFACSSIKQFVLGKIKKKLLG